jgi:hypothetical protein
MTNTVGNLNTPLSPIVRSSRQRSNIETSELLYTLDQINMVYIYRVFQPKTSQYTFFSAAHGIFSKLDHILGHKARLNKFKNIEITSSIISDHDRIELELNNKKYPRKYSRTWRLNNILLEKTMGDGEIWEEIKKFLESSENENSPTRICRTQQRPC